MHGQHSTRDTLPMTHSTTIDAWPALHPRHASDGTPSRHAFQDTLSMKHCRCMALSPRHAADGTPSRHAFQDVQSTTLLKHFRKHPALHLPREPRHTAAPFSRQAKALLQWTRHLETPRARNACSLHAPMTDTPQKPTHIVLPPSYPITADPHSKPPKTTRTHQPPHSSRHHNRLARPATPFTSTCN